MKRSILKFSAITLTAGMAFVMSCNKDDDPTLSVDPNVSQAEFTSNGATLTSGGTAIANATFTVSTNQGEWNAVATPSGTWLEVVPNKANNTFKLSAANYTGVAPLPEATVTITAGKAKPVEIRVTQQSAAPSMSVSPSYRTIAFAADGASATASGETLTPPIVYTVTTNVDDWKAESSQGWLKVVENRANKTFTLTADRNDAMTAPANATVTVKATGVPDVPITVTQAARLPFLELSAQEVVINSAGTQATTGSLTVTVNTNYASWSAVSSAAWLTVTENKTNNTFTMSAPNISDFADSYTATVTVTAGIATETLPVKQVGNPNKAPKAAATGTIWVLDKYDVKLIISDYIQYDGDGKVAAGTIGTFNNSHTVGDYIHNPGFKGYMYNLAYIIANEEKMCPAPWRVPKPDDLKTLSKALGGTGEHQQSTRIDEPDYQDPENAEALIGRFLEAGFQYSGRYRNGGYNYQNNVGYISSNSTAVAPDGNGIPNPDKANHLLFKNTNQDKNWAVFPWNEGASSQEKNTGIPVRCVKDVQ